jgi:DNA-binding IclR family transcriptional regulator
MMRRARRIGYALNDKQVTPGALSIGLPISNPYGPPYAAVSIGAIVDRMSPERQKELVEILRSEIQGCEARLKL